MREGGEACAEFGVGYEKLEDALVEERRRRRNADSLADEQEDLLEEEQGRRREADEWADEEMDRAETRDAPFAVALRAPGLQSG